MGTPDESNSGYGVYARSVAGTALGAYSAQGIGLRSFDRAFAAAVDTSTSYRVFITPDGETHGSFVAQKTSRGFLVRETEGGRSNVAFDYRIVATSRGGAGRRMSLTSLAAVPSAPQAPLRVEPASSGHSAR